MAEAPRDQNFIPTVLLESSTSPGTVLSAKGSEVTGRLLVDIAGAGGGSVESVSVATANGFAGTVADANVNPIITLTTSVTGILEGNGTAISAASTTGTGAIVRTASPTITSATLVTPALGTPASGTLTNATGLPISTGVSGLGTGVATFLATPSSANLASALTDETGTGVAVFNNSPTFVDDITIGTAGTATGSILMKGTTSGTVTIKTADAAGTWTLTLPDTDGDSGQVLTTNGSGVTSWASAGGVPTTITVANEATDTTCFVAFFTAASGDLAPKTNANLTFNSSTGVLTAGQTIVGSISGNAATATAVAVGGITGLGTNVATALAVNVGSAGAFVVLGGALGTPSSGTVTNLTGTASININGTVGATTPGTGAFTTLSASSAITASTTIELGHASDTTLARVSAGVMSVEGVRVITSAGTTSGTILKNNGTTFVASTETYAAPGTSGNVLTSDGTNWTSAAPSGSSPKLYMSTTEVTMVAGDAGNGANVEKTLFTTTITGGTLGTNGGISFRMFINEGSMAQAASSWTFRIKYGGVTQVTMTSGGMADDNTSDEMQGYVEGYILADGATNAQKITGTCWMAQDSRGESENSATVEVTKNYFDANRAAGTVDSTADQTFSITVQATSNAANDAVFQWCLVQRI